MWYYQGTELKKCPEWAYGFIYKITLENKDDDINPLFYFGQKVIETDAKRVIGAKELKEKGKKPFNKYKSKRGEKKGQWIYFEAGKTETWKDYNSSSDLVKEMIENGVKFKKEILEFTGQKALLNWKEYSQIICSGCMESEYCLNRRVGNFHYRNIIQAIKKDQIKNNRSGRPL
jgi:hypothetical protein